LVKVSMYTLSTCPWCRKTKKFFTDRKIPFEYIDYDLADEKVQEKIMEEMSEYGGSAFPFVKIDGNIVIGYNPEKYSQILGP
jgi:glutaredoxin